MRRALLGAMAGLAALSGCGGSSHHAAAGATAAQSSPPGLNVVRAWADALRRGDVKGATSLFAVPALVQNGTPPVRLTTRDAVRRFNVSLPCGARVLYGIPHHGYLLVEFRLTDRRGEGAVTPCTGRGDTAATAMRIVAGRIREWRRVPDLRHLPASPAPGTPS